MYLAKDQPQRTISAGCCFNCFHHKLVFFSFHVDAELPEVPDQLCDRSECANDGQGTSGSRWTRSYTAASLIGPSRTGLDASTNAKTRLLRSKSTQTRIKLKLKRLFLLHTSFSHPPQIVQLSLTDFMKLSHGPK